MKINIEYKERSETKSLLELTDIKKKILKHGYFDEDLEAEIERLVPWIIEQHIKDQMTKLKNEWLPKLKESGVESIPLDDEEFAELVFKHKDYKSRSQRDWKHPDKIKSISDLPPGR